MVDDFDLLNLSETSCRFERIAKTVFKKSYTNKYFVFHGDTKDRKEMYEGLFDRFGRYADIKAVAIVSIQNVDRNHWLSELLRQYTNQLQKLKLENCSIRNNGVLFQHISITHLFIYGGRLDILPNYRNLKELELNGVSISLGMLEEVLRNNPELESIILRCCDSISMLLRYANATEIILECIAENVPHLKKLDLVKSFGITGTVSLPDAQRLK